MANDIFLQISLLLGVTAAIACIARLLKQPLLIAYIIGGILSGPLLLNILHEETELFHLFSRLGIILLLFVVGLSLNFSYIKKIGKVAVIAGLGQVIFTAIVGFYILTLLNFSQISALYLAVAMTFSSTIIITKLLSDKKDMDSVYGRYTIGLMLVQDVIAIFFMIILTTTREGQGSLLSTLAPLLLKGGVLVSCIYFLSKFLLPLLLDRIAKSSEFLFLFTIAWCFGVTSLVNALGFSHEIGAIMAGISLGSSPYQPEINSRVKPLRDFFLIMFFIILGSNLNLTNIEKALVPSGILTVFVLSGHLIILYILLRLMKFTRRNSFLAGITTTQVSEFGFILLFQGQVAGYIGQTEVSIFTLLALATILISSYLITYNEQIYRFFIPLFSVFGKDKYQQHEDRIPVYDAWVVGYHRMGWKVCETLKEKGISFAVIDYNPEVVTQLQKKGIPVYFGDVADVEFLSAVPVEKSKLIISTIPEPDDQLTFIKYIRSLTNKPYIIANVVHAHYIANLYAAGASYVMMPHLLGGYRIAEILREKTLSKQTFKKLRREQEKELQLRVSAKTHD